jgi:Fur family ferric uptake transcriptional regulator
MNPRNTKAKAAILEALKNAKRALSHEVLQAGLDGEVDRATIYRVLNRCFEEGLVHRIVGDDGKQYFALCINCQEKHHQHNHFHFRCFSCGKVECLPSPVAVELPQGYRSENFNGVISGYCSACS